MKEKSKNTVDPEEVERFSRIADEWWDERGKFQPLHRMNPLRIGYIRDHACAHFDRNPDNPRPLAGLTLLDIGCGGGLISEPMARLGASVTGIDASKENIAVAGAHAAQSRLGIDYRCMSAEQLLSGAEDVMPDKDPSLSATRHPPPATFDIVLALEIVEHVADMEAFVEASCQLVRPGGLIVYSTLNRTLKSYAMAIAGAEYVLRWLPRGTHDWKKFLRPSELAGALRRHGIKIQEMTGMVLNPLNFQWRFSSSDLGVNYLIVGKR